MRGIVVPERTEDFTADPVELFFDLAFVFAFSQLVSHIVHHPTWTGFGELALLFGIIWIAWSQFTWSANAVSGNARSVRGIFVLATAASVPMGASVTTAFDEGGTVFAVSASFILLMGLALMAVALDTDSPEFRSAVRYSVPNVLTAVLLVAGSFADHDARVVIWVLALGVVAAGTVAAGSYEWVMRPGHFAERHGLILIVALGEVIVAIGIAVVGGLQEGEGLPATTVWSLIGAGVFGGLLWWGYFDRPSPAFEHRAEGLSGVDAGRFARDVYTYAHAPLVFGVILAAAALEEISLHPKDPLPDAFRLMLLAGIALYLGGVLVGVARAFGVVARERLVSIALVGLLVLVADSWDGVALLLVLDAVLLATLVFEHLRIEGPSAQATDQPAGTT